MTGKPKYNKVGILFSGGPAPSANTVISATALNFLDNNLPVIGVFRGYEFIRTSTPKSASARPTRSLTTELHRCK